MTVPFPSEKAEEIGNAYLISIFGQHFGSSESIDLAEIDEKVCTTSLWLSDSSVLCSMKLLQFDSSRVQVIFKSDKQNEV
jgi:hypothetical protein